MIKKREIENRLQTCRQIFQTKDEKKMKEFRDTLYKLVLDAEEAGCVESLKESFMPLSDEYERIHLLLEMDAKERNDWRYFREIYTLVNFVLDQCKCYTEKNILKHIKKSYPLAVPVLSTIKEHHTISGKDLQEAVGMNNRSGLTNFLNRIEPYNLVTVRKFGTTSYISLTENGRTLLNLETSDAERTGDGKNIKFETFVSFLSGLEQALSEEKPNTYILMHEYLKEEINIEHKRIIKHKVDGILSQRDRFANEQFLKNMIDRMELNEEYNEEYSSVYGRLSQGWHISMAQDYYYIEKKSKAKRGAEYV